MKRICLLTIIMLNACVHAYAQHKHVTEIPVETGERWWGTDIHGRSWGSRTAGAQTSPFVTNMLVSSAGRYLWSADPMSVTTDGTKLTVESSAEKPEVQKAGKTLREAYLVCVHKNLAGERCMPASDLLTRPVYGPANRFSVTWGQREIMEYARRIIGEGLPAGTVVIPEGWCSPNVPFTFSQELFPDPHAMIAELHGMGFKVMLTVTPRTPSTGRIFSGACLYGYVIPGTEVEPWTTLDMGNHLFFESFRDGFVRFRTEYPFDGYRLECAYVPRRTADDPFLLNWEKLAEGIAMCEMSGTYERPFTPYVSECGGSGAELFSNLLSASLSGSVCKAAQYVPYAEQDSRALYMAASAFFPVASMDYEPWEFGERVLSDRVKAALLFRASLADYMDNLLKESARTGEPIARHMEYQFPRQGFTDCDGQFMLGPKYLIVPCLDGGSKCMVRLPKGRWADRDGNRFKGPLVTEVDCSAGIVYFELLK